MNYDDMIQEAMLGVVKKVLKNVQDDGLTGEHHFFICFMLDHPQVVVSDYLKDRYPKEMTIVLQYQFWDLMVHDTYFAVSLSFNDITERLEIPFGALTSFVDPSVNFGLQFSPLFETDTSSNVISLASFRKDANKN